MTTSMLLQATPGPVAELPVPSVHRNEIYTMLQAPSIGGVRRFGAGRKGYGVCRRKAVMIGYRAQSRIFSLPGTKKLKKDAAEELEPDVKMGTRKIRKLPGTLKFGKGEKDDKVVFVAGATGKVGSRVVRELLALGFQVRAGVRDVSRGQALLEMSDETKSSDDEPKSWVTSSLTHFAAKLFKPRTPSRRQRVELVECDLEKEDTIENSLGDAGVVVCAIGASEKEVLDVTGPYRIDFKATENLVKAATNAKVNHFILVSSLGTTKLGWPASVLNLFWGVLIWKAKAEKALEDSGLPYTIVRPGGMERPTDAYKETHNLVLAPRDTYSGGQVSSLQVAELIATCVSQLELARYKVLEVVAETTAPLRPIEDLLSEVPAETEETTSSELEPVSSPIRKNFKFSRQEEEKSRKAAEADKKKKKELLARYERDLLVAREEEEEAKRKADEALSLKAKLEKRTADLQVQARTAAKEVKKAKALENAIVTAARQGRRLSDKEKSEILEAAGAEFDGEPKTRADTEKVPRGKNKTSVASTISKPEKGLKFKALQAAKLKEADDRAEKKFAEKDWLAKQQEQKKVNVEEERKAKAKAEAEAKAQAEKDRVTQEENEAKAKEDAEAIARSKKHDIAKLKDAKDNGATVTAQKPTFRWPWQRKRTVDDVPSATFAETGNLKQNEDLSPQTASEPVSAASDEALLESPDLGALLLPSVPAIEEEVSKFAEEVVEDAEAMVDKARTAKEEAATRASIALEKAKGAKSGSFRWPWQKKIVEDDASSETSAVNERLEENEELPSQVDSEPELSSTPFENPDSQGTTEKSENVMEQPSNVIIGLATAIIEVSENTASDKALLESPESETCPSAIEEEAPKLAREVVDDKEAMLVKARKAKEEAATRATIALEKAKGPAFGSFRWPWQKESAKNDASSKTSAITENLDENEDLPSQVDSEPELSSTLLEDSESEGTKDSTQQPSNVIIGLATAGEVPDGTVVSNEVPHDDEKGSLSKPVEEKNGASLLSEKASEPVSAASDDALLESPDSETSPSPPSVPAIEEEAVVDTEATVGKARKAKEEAATRAAIALEKARGVAVGSFRWPWQQE